MTLRDQIHENRINHELMLALAATSADAMRLHMARASELVAQRSPERVAEMEKHKGLGQ